MEPAFWDSSSLVPLCVLQLSTAKVEELSKRYSIVVWWAAPVELKGAFARLVRVRALTTAGETQAQLVLDKLRRNWREVDLSDRLRERAESLLDRFDLTAADAMQLAAALTWCMGHPRNRPFISGICGCSMRRGRLDSPGSRRSAIRLNTRFPRSGQESRRRFDHLRK